MSFPGTAAGPCIAEAVTHDVATSESWMDLLVADDEWVRREFEDIVAAAWGGAGPPCKRTSRGSHQPRWRGPRRRLHRAGRVRRADAPHARASVHVRGPPVGRTTA
jgi:hypothetical protein